MFNIRGRLPAALEEANFSFVAELQTLPQDHPLGSLVEQAFGVKWNSPEAIKLLKSWHKTTWLREYGLLALCGAALTLWVFQQSQVDIFFDGYHGERSTSSTSRYRKTIKLVGQSGTYGNTCSNHELI